MRPEDHFHGHGDDAANVIDHVHRHVLQAVDIEGLLVLLWVHDLLLYVSLEKWTAR